MSKVSKTAKASEVKKAAKEKEVLTFDKALAEIRNLRAAKLAVLNVEYIDLLLAGYDSLTATATRLSEERNAALDQIPAPDPFGPARQQSVRELEILLKEVAPVLAVEGEFVSAFAIRVLRTLKEENDTLTVEVRDLMATVKRQEKQLAGFGVIVNPNPDIPPVPADQAF